MLQSLTGPSETCLRSPQRPRPSCFNPSQVRLKLEYVAESLAAVPALQSLTGPSETRRRQQFRRLQRGLQSLTGPSETILGRVERDTDRELQSLTGPSETALRNELDALDVLQSLTGPSETRS